MNIIDNMVQGSDSWHELRAKRFTASEAPAMMGASKYQSRSDLIKQKATGVAPEVSPAQQRIFDKGHAAEASARPIAERIVGGELYPCTCEDDSQTYLASMDGLDLMCEAGFEHKLINADLRTATADTLDDHYKFQMDHQMMVTGADRILFMSSDGTEEDCNWFWYERDEERIKQLIAAWDQFAIDLANYTPTETKPEAVGKNIEDLPALRIDLTGEVRASNLAEFKEIALARIASINTDLVTDEDFASAEKAVKFLDKGEKQLEATKKAALEQTASIDELFKTVDHLKAEMRDKRLSLNKRVKEEKENRRLQIAADGYARFNAWLNEQQSPIPVSASFSPDAAMKGKKTITSLQSAVDDELARAKIEAAGLINLYKSNKATLDQHGEFQFLFSDWQQLIQKQPDDLLATIKARIAEHKEAEQKRLDAERERIRQDEERKARAALERKEVIREPINKQQPASEPAPIQRHTITDVAADDTVTISRIEYEALLHDSALLAALRAAGVDNWPGYADAVEAA